jgi:hypothetical protein
MAFWVRKKADNESEKKEAGASHLLKKKEEKKNLPPKRIDNLRIAQKLHVSLKSLGTSNEYHFLTKDLSATGMFVLCADHKRYPFQMQSTLIETRVLLKADGEPETHELHCLCKIARLVDGQVKGFGVRIIQITSEQRHLLEQFIAKHGSPDNFVPYTAASNPHEERMSDFSQHPASEAPAADAASGEIGQDTPPRSLATSA